MDFETANFEDGFHGEKDGDFVIDDEDTTFHSAASLADGQQA